MLIGLLTAVVASICYGTGSVLQAVGSRKSARRQAAADGQVTARGGPSLASTAQAAMTWEFIVGTVLAVLRGYGIEGEAALRALAGLWASIHGFVVLEARGALQGLADPDGTFERLVATFALGFGSTDAGLPSWRTSTCGGDQ